MPDSLSTVHRRAIFVALAIAGCALAPRAAAQDISPCANAGAYPGDSGVAAQLAVWMANGAIGAGLPGELPVMGALVESGLKNLRFGDADAAGYFQMRVSIWNQGQYAGFPDNPDLQLKWFIDQAIAINQSRVALGLAPYGADPNQWGEWAADVLRPAAQYRGRYQLRLDDARALIAAGCAAPGGTGSPGAGPGVAPETDSTAPVVRVAGRRTQNLAKQGGLVVEAACPAEACSVVARGSVAVPGASKVYRIKSARRQLPRGGMTKLTLRPKPSVRRAITRALKRGRRLRARIVVTASDTLGNATSTRRTIILIDRKR